MLDKIAEAEQFLRARLEQSPDTAVITGTGLGQVAEKVLVKLRIPYAEIPNFPVSTTVAHKGTLAFGSMHDKSVLVMEGRFHLYEGYSAQDIGFPIRVMASLGIRNIIICSATGGLNPKFKNGDLMVVTDHINLMGTNPLVGPNLDKFGPRFPDMAESYDSKLIKLAKKVALNQGIELREGVYVGVLGPSLETPAETRFLRMIGADAVGMSTVPEVITAVHCGLRVLVFAVITNVNLPDCMAKIDIEQVIKAAEEASPTLASLCEGVIRGLDK